MIKTLTVASALALTTAFGSAQAGLQTFQTFGGNVGLSSDGFGSSSGTGIISAEVPAGSSVIGAYLYTATPGTPAAPTTVTFEGTAVSYNASFVDTSSGATLSSHRTDVTSIVSNAIGGGGGFFDFDVAEGANNDSIDGHALVVVYDNPGLPESTIGILDGFADVTGDTTTINFADPIDPTDPDFVAEMRLGISFSCCDQRSRVEVNGGLLTENAGNFDDGEDLANGSLITVGGFDDAFSPSNPSYEEDTERYDLSSFVSQGDTSIVIDTFNASRDDNIFLALFNITGRAGVNAPPPPPTTPGPTDPVPLPAGAYFLITGLAGVAAARKMKSSR